MKNDKNFLFEQLIFSKIVEAKIFSIENKVVIREKEKDFEKLL